MEQYLIDTNVISHYFSASLPPNGMQFMDSIFDAIPNISIITQIELLSWKTNIESEQKVEEFITDSNVLELSSTIVSKCVIIRRNKKIKTPDAIIAATAIVNNYILITSNEIDFSNIKGLKIINPFKLL
ncbi:MAG: type II toxin-antitoxin system VapC family toxin [Bacteroidia bacterium]|nr:type II toxin-antitoxin system VapC family toxin [Bacteroidia bacterium]MCF8428028.1 type II toxin-antitoxin system VapC family toxin [Bacteroidia bacterium]MCF8448206.1 type II toxin-antitoxin system VapC family toxin [Bacteroidia bacterium]